MKVSLNWLKEYVTVNQTVKDIVHKMTMAGVAIEGVTEGGKTKDGKMVSNILTCKILEVKQHPNADKLTVCTVDIGKEKPITIVTGAKNIKEGDVVPVALNGAIVASGQKIVTSKLRGIESEGMFCSYEEIGLDSKLVSIDQREGIYLLPEETLLGLDVIKLLGLDDLIFDFEITANRADCFSMHGIAREIAVVLGETLNLQKFYSLEKEDILVNNSEKITVVIEEKDLCTRFMAKVLNNVKVKESPMWLKNCLMSAGVRPINNVVDVTNYVMLEMGQPLHAYDYDFIKGQKLVIRRAKKGETLTTLDGVKRNLEEEMLVVADTDKALGLAGIMGGEESEVRLETKTIVLEAACFNGLTVRKTAKKLGLRSEASARFERGIDLFSVKKALLRATELLEKLGAGEAENGFVDCGEIREPNLVLKEIVFDPEKVNCYLGTEIAKEEMVEILEQLGFKCLLEKEKLQKVCVPSWRQDVKEDVDLIEEIARIWGYERIKEAMPADTILDSGDSFKTVMCEEIRAIMSAMSFDEIITYSFSNVEELKKIRLETEGELLIPLINPIVKEMSHLRTNLLGKMLETMCFNLQRKNEDLRFFEIGAVFKAKSLPLKELPTEKNFLCAGLTGKRKPLNWHSKKETVDFYDAKGVLEEILFNLGFSRVEFRSGVYPTLHNGKTAFLYIDNEEIGVVGEIHPEVQANFAMKRKSYLMLLDLDLLFDKYNKKIKYQKISAYPEIVRDLSLELPLTITAQEVENCIWQNGDKYLTQVVLFDIYSGEQLEKNKKSMAFSLCYQSQEKTLTDQEVAESLERIIKALKEDLAAELRI